MLCRNAEKEAVVGLETNLLIQHECINLIEQFPNV